jgi:outer membrane lipoprotein-sorting protein
LRKILTITTLCLVLVSGAIAQKKPTTKKPAKPAATAPAAPAPSAPAAAAPSNSAALEAVLTAMDRSAAEFRSAEADFTWEQFQAVVQETDVQKGKVYFVRHEKDTHMAADITVPDKKSLIFTDGKIRFYQPRIDQLTEYDATKNKTEVESFLVLGFGGRGHDLLKSFEVKLLGQEAVEGVNTAKLELIPRSQKVRNSFERFILWVDTTRDISLKQQAFEPSGDYRTAYYTQIKLNEKVPDDVFKLKTTSKTKVVRQ